MESNVTNVAKGLFASQWARKIFMKILYISWIGLFLPWFSFEPSMQGYVWGFLFFPYIMLQITGLIVLFHNEPKNKIGCFISSIFTEICLITFPVVYFWQMMFWYEPIVTSENHLATGLSITYPLFWVSLGLSIIPVIAFPVLRRWEKDDIIKYVQ